MPVLVEPELTGQERDLLADRGYRQPSELAHRIRNKLRAEHERCRNPGCALTFIWAEDVQEILDARDRLLAVCSCRPRESGEAPDVPERDCPVHGEGAL